MVTNHMAMRIMVYMFSIILLFPTLYLFFGSSAFVVTILFIFGIPLIVLAGTTRFVDMRERLLQLHEVTCVYLSIAAILLLSSVFLWRILNVG